MKKYVICTFVDSFEFPLREALRKQVWWRALEKQKNYKVTIIVFHSDSETVMKDGIEIKFLNKNRLSTYKIKADYIDFITTIVEIRSIMAFFAKGKKSLTICDGYPLGDTKIFFRKLIVKLLPFFFSDIYVFSKYQKNLLNLSSIKQIMPILPELKKCNVEKYKNPTLLYMGHLSYFKGIDTLLESYSILKQEISSLDMIIANNMVRGDSDLIMKVQELKDKYPDSIILKGVIDPIEELSKAWIYIYPFIKPGGTMSFALSLYESQECGTPFVACNVGANEEFFGPKNLIKPNNTNEMVSIIRELLDEY